MALTLRTSGTRRRRTAEGDLEEQAVDEDRAQRQRAQEDQVRRVGVAQRESICWLSGLTPSHRPHERGGDAREKRDDRTSVRRSERRDMPWTLV